MSILELYHHGVINFLFRRGLLSSSTLVYVEYYHRFRQERANGSGYRESIRKLSSEFGVSETTIKKAVRIVQDSGTSDDLAKSVNGPLALKT
jgi:hypothetical protein